MRRNSFALRAHARFPLHTLNKHNLEQIIQKAKDTIHQINILSFQLLMEKLK